MSRSINTPSHLGRKVIGVVILVALAVVIIIGVVQNTPAHPTTHDTPAPTITTIVTTSPPPSMPASPAPPAAASSCHKAIDVATPAETEQGFVDLVWEYESAYLSADATNWNTLLQKAATSKYREENRRPVTRTLSTLTTTVITDGSVIAWSDNSTKTERTVSTIACILVKDGEQALTLPYTVPAHYTTWVKTGSGWRIDRETDQGW